VLDDVRVWGKDVGCRIRPGILAPTFYLCSKARGGGYKAACYCYCQITTLTYGSITTTIISPSALQKRPCSKLLFLYRKRRTTCAKRKENAAPSVYPNQWGDQDLLIKTGAMIKKRKPKKKKNSAKKEREK
jgi:hypothetical protein